MKRVTYDALPIPPLDKKRKGFSGTASVFKDTLVIDIWKDGDYRARYCMDEKGKYAVRINGDWRQQKLCSVCESYWNYAEIGFIKKTDRQVISNFLDSIKSPYDYGGLVVERRIDYIESDYCREVNNRTFDRKLNRIKQLVDSTPELPSDFDDWCIETVFKNQHFWFYNKETDSYSCTACGKSHKNHKLKHNDETVCSRSGKPVTVKRRVKEIKLLDNVMILQQANDDFSIARHFQIQSFWSAEGKSIVHNEKVRIFLPKNYKTNVKILYGQRTFASEKYQTWWDSNLYNRHTAKCYCYPHGIKEALDKTIYEVIDIESLAKKKWRLDYNGLMRHPNDTSCYEYLAKGNFRRLAEEDSTYFDWYYRGQLNINGKNDTEVLGLDKQRVNRLRQMDGGITALVWLREEASDGRKIPTETIEYFDKNGILPKSYGFISDRMSPAQFANYVKRMSEQYKRSPAHIITQWADYLSMAKRLKMNVNDEIVYRTKDLCRRHDELVERINLLKNKQSAADMAKKFPKVNKTCKTALKKYEWSDGKYCVIAPKNIADIMREGASLHHCVGTSERYYERINTGETYIMFLRKADEPEVSFYTLEIEPSGTVRQKRSAYDRQPDIDLIKPFVSAWQKEIKKRLTAEDKALIEKSEAAREKNMTELKTSNVWLFDKLKADLMPA